MNEYFNAISKNAPFVTLAVLGLGTFYGKLGLTGRAQLLAAFLTGLVSGGAFQIAAVGMPADFTGWFYVALSAILMGLMPSGVYEALKASSKV